MLQLVGIAKAKASFELQKPKMPEFKACFAILNITFCDAE